MFDTTSYEIPVDEYIVWSFVVIGTEFRVTEVYEPDGNRHGTGRCFDGHQGVYGKLTTRPLDDSFDPQLLPYGSDERISKLNERRGELERLEQQIISRSGLEV